MYINVENMGGKAPRVVPALTNCTDEEEHTVFHTGKPVHGIIEAYKNMVRGGGG